MKLGERQAKPGQEYYNVNSFLLEVVWAILYWYSLWDGRKRSVECESWASLGFSRFPDLLKWKSWWITLKLLEAFVKGIFTYFRPIIYHHSTNSTFLWKLQSIWENLKYFFHQEWLVNCRNYQQWLRPSDPAMAAIYLTTWPEKF